MLMRLFLLMFVLRAAVPVGFMPDPAALRDGRIEIVVCTPAGLKTVTVDAEGPTGQPAEDDGSDASSLNACPFQTVIAKAIAEPAAVGEPLRRTAITYVIAASSDRIVTSPAQGPPIGPRAPPASLG